jgi:hypothetical protein
MKPDSWYVLQAAAYMKKQAEAIQPKSKRRKK